MISSLDVKDKENDVRVLELEVRELELNDRITQLKAEQLIDEGCVGCCKVVDIAAGLQKELDVCHSTIKNFKAIETRETDRLHKTISDQLRTIHYLKQEIVGRKDQLMEQRERTEFMEREVHRLEEKHAEHADTIEELKDRNSEDLHELYDIDKEEIDRLKHVVSARDLTIKSLTTICQSSGSERNKLTSTIDEKDKMLEKQGREILRLRDMYDVVWDKVHTLEETIEDLDSEPIEKQANIDAERSSMKSNYEIILQNRRNRGDKLEDNIKGLEVELSARKQDSEVLKEVVDVAHRWSDERIASRPAMNQIAYIVKDYHDAQEEPPETSIDETQDITVTVAFLELP